MPGDRWEFGIGPDRHPGLGRGPDGSFVWGWVPQHREGVADGFTRKYGCKTLVWYEAFGELAIRREKQMKEWKRLWKLRVIEEMNPEWDDLFESLFQDLGPGLRRGDERV